MEHLECLPISEHRSKDNAMRYKQRELAILSHYDQNPALTHKELGQLFGLTGGGIYEMLKRRKLRGT